MTAAAAGSPNLRGQMAIGASSTESKLATGLHQNSGEFYALHGVAIACLFASLLMASLNVHTIRTFGRRVRLYDRPLAERLILYMALCDLSYSLVHMVDHVYMIVTHTHPPQPLCVVIAFGITTLALSEASLVMLASLNACVMTVMWRRVRFGRYDLGIIVVAIGAPVTIGIVNISIGAYGPSWAWCGLSVTSTYGLYLNHIYTVSMLVVFIFCAICYSSIWITIRTAYWKSHGTTSGTAGEASEQLTYSALSNPTSGMHSDRQARASKEIDSDIDDDMSGNGDTLCNMQGLDIVKLSLYPIGGRTSPSSDNRDKNDTSVLELTRDDNATVGNLPTSTPNGMCQYESRSRVSLTQGNTQEVNTRQPSTVTCQGSQFVDSLECFDNVENGAMNSRDQLIGGKLNKTSVERCGVLNTDTTSNHMLNQEDTVREYNSKPSLQTNSILLEDLPQDGGVEIVANQTSDMTDCYRPKNRDDNDSDSKGTQNSGANVQECTNKTTELSNTRKLNRLNRTAKIMSVFVCMFGLQWVWYLIYSVWDMVGTPHIGLIFMVVIFTNLGGVFNYYAYTYLRGKYTGNNAPRSNSSVQQVYSISQTDKQRSEF